MYSPESTNKYYFHFRQNDQPTNQISAVEIFFRLEKKELYWAGDDEEEEDTAVKVELMDYIDE
jgi:hypothetical protein